MIALIGGAIAHASEANPGYFETGSTKFDVFHDLLHQE